MKTQLIYNGKELELDVSLGSGQLPDGSTHQADVSAESNGLRTLTVDGRRVTLAISSNSSAIEVSYEGRTYKFDRPSVGKSRSGKAKTGSLQTPMPGIVSAVMVAEGDHVEVYAPLMVVEAMKVMATLEAPFAGVIKKLHASKGSQVKQGETLVEMEPLTPTEERS
ncbi:MAG: biotin/lipoyl-containing protein [Chthonomonadales bacterium]